MNQRRWSPGALLKVRYDYPDVLIYQKAAGLIRMAWLSITLILIAMVITFFDGSTPVEVIRFIILGTVGIGSLLLIVSLTNRGSVTVASVMYVMLAFIIAVSVYVPGGPTSLFFAIFSIPIISAGVLLDRRGAAVMVVLALVTVIMTALLSYVGLLTPFIGSPPNLVDVVTLGPVFILHDALMLLTFVNGQRAVARQNRLMSSELRGSASVSQTIGQQIGLRDLLDRTIDLLRSQFGYYFVQIFLAEPKTKLLVLQSGTGQIPGQRRIAPDDKSVINEVAQSGKSRRVDMSSPESERAEFLGGTLAEVIIPLRRGEQVLGVLDIHSVDARAFGRHEIEAIEAIAIQIALSIENIQLSASLKEKTSGEERASHQLQIALNQIERISQESSGQVWKRYLANRSQGVIGLDWRQGTFISDQTLSPSIIQAMKLTGPEIHIEDNQQIMSVPVILRGQVLGVMEFRASAKRQWDSRSIEVARAISQRLALALENVRLFDQSQAVAQREQTVNKIAAQLQAKTDVDTLLKAAAESFQQALGATRTSIKLGTPEQDASRNGGSAT